MTTLNLHEYPESCVEAHAVAERAPADWREMRLASVVSAVLPWGLSLSVHLILVLAAFALLWWLLLPLPVGGSTPGGDIKGQPAAGPMDVAELADRDAMAYAPVRQHYALPSEPAVSAKSRRADEQGADGAALTSGTNIAVGIEESPVLWIEGARIKAPSTPVYDVVKAKKEADLLAIGMVPTPSAAGSPSGPFEAALTRVGGSAPQRVVIVIDASGSVVDRLPAVTREVGRWVAMGLTSRQMFTVIAYRGDGVLEPRPTGLKEATTSTRAEVNRWLAELVPGGRTTPEPGLERALSYRPDAVVLICDAAWLDRRGGSEKADRLVALAQTAGRGAVISTVVLADEPIGGDGAGADHTDLFQLSRQTGGSYRRIGTAEMGWD